jgi:hypothetical protein
MRVMALLLALLTPVGAMAADPEWTPDRWRDEDTLQLHTVDAEGPYDFPVWLVVLDGDLYVRLGSRAARRVEGSTTWPALGVDVGGRHFARVQAESVPAMAEAVNEAMAEKYWSDVFIRFFSHPLTLRLRAE